MCNLLFWGKKFHILIHTRDVLSSGHSQVLCLLQDPSVSNSFISSWDETELLQVGFNGDMDSELLHPPQSIRCKQTANTFIGIDSFCCLL